MLLRNLLWLSNDPKTPSAFGKVTAEVCTRLLKRGYDVVVAGNQTQSGSYYYSGDLLVLGRLRHEFFADILSQYMQIYNRDYFITFSKISSLQWIPKVYLDLCTKWIAYVTIESELMEPAEETLYPAREALAVLVPSKFNYDQLKKYIDPVYLCQLGVSDAYYRESEDVKRGEREGIGIGEEDFVFGTVGMNLWDRKDLPRLIKAFSIFIKRNPDAPAWLYLHTNIYRSEIERSYPLALIAAKYGVANRIKTPRYNPELNPYTDNQMRALYNIFDVFVSATRGESFCIPVLESMACGTPVIVPNHTALPELVGENERGWLVKCSDTTIPLYYPEFDEEKIVDLEDIVKTMEYAYYHREEIEKKRSNCVEFAKNYLWDKLIDEQLIPALEDICGKD